MDNSNSTVYQLQVGGKRFALDSDDVEKLGSSFLTTLIDPESKFSQPEDGIYTIEADEACFFRFSFLESVWGFATVTH